MRHTYGQKITSANLNKIANSVAASYTIYKDGNDYYGECNIPGGEDLTANSSASIVIQAAHNALSEGGKIYIDSVSELTTTVTISNNNVELEFVEFGGTGENAIDCQASPAFNITGFDVKITNGQFRTTVPGTNIFYVTDAASVEFNGQKFFAAYSINRDMLPFYFDVTANYIDVKVNNVFAKTKYFFKIEKDSAASVSRMNFLMDNIVWRNDQATGIMFELFGDTHSLQNVQASNLYGYNVGQTIKIHTLNSGSVAFCNFINARLDTPTAIYIHSESGFISDITFTNVTTGCSGANGYGLKAEATTGDLHSIHGTNFRVQMAAGAGATALRLAPAGTAGADGKFFSFQGLRIYDCAAGQVSVSTHNNVQYSNFYGPQMYLEYASLGTGLNVQVISPFTIARGTATIGNGTTTTGNIAHGLAGTPTVVFGFGSTTDTEDLYCSSKDATNIVIDCVGAVGGDRTIYWRAEYIP